MFSRINDILSAYLSVTLEEMANVRLMNRIDTKYVTSVDKISSFFELASDRYKVQEIEGERMPVYQTIYLDTEKKDMFHMHQLGRRVREKIRIRTYTSSGISFLEIKNKNNKGRTNKRRISVSGFDDIYKGEMEDFLSCNAWYSLSELSPQMENKFRRITLVNHQMTERLTIDLGIVFRDVISENEVVLEDLAVIELKRDGLSRSPVRDILRELRIAPMGFSKYCMGSVLTDPTLRHNRLKMRLRRLEHMARASI